MDKSKNKTTFVNVPMPKGLAADLQLMAMMQDTDRVKLIRGLIRKEWKRFIRRQEAQPKQIAQT